MSSVFQRVSTRPDLSLPVLLVLFLAFLVVLPPGLTIVTIGAVALGIGLTAVRLENYLIATVSGAFLFRIAIVSVDTALGILPVPPIAPYHSQRALAVASGWTEGQFVVPSVAPDSMRILFAHLLAPFYLLFGSSQVAGRLAIATYSLLIGYLIFRIAVEVVDRRTATLATAAVLFWPTIVYRSVVIQREVLVVVTLLTFLWAAMRWVEEITIQNVLVAAGAVVMVYVFRAENLVLVATLLGVVFLVKGRERPYHLAGAALLSLPIFAYFVLNFGRLTGFGTTLTPAAIDAFAHGRDHGDAAYLIWLHYRSWLDIVVYAPLKVLYFLYTPFPWQIRGVTEFVVGMSAAGLLGATVFARRGIALLRPHREHLSILLAYLCVGVLSYSIIEMNYGAAVRRRILFVPIILLFAVVGVSNLSIRLRTSE